MNVNRQFRNFEAGLGYTWANGVGIDHDAVAGPTVHHPDFAPVRRRPHTMRIEPTTFAPMDEASARRCKPTIIHVDEHNRPRELHVARAG